jgi:ElaB/YqjD/DUF883 family membrane-anchored ribosome-binding protein
MNERAMDQMRGMRDSSEASARRLVDSAQDVAGRAGAYMQARMGDVSERAQSLARDASTRVEQLTGRPVESWSGDAQRFVRDHPFQAMALTIGLGYILGKLMTRRG